MKFGRARFTDRARTFPAMPGAAFALALVAWLPAGHFLAPQARADTFCYTGPPVEIADDHPAGVRLVFDIEGVEGPIRSVAISFPSFGRCDAKEGSENVALDHTYIADLQMFLSSPDGRHVLLMQGDAGSGNNLCDTVLDDRARVSFAQASPSDAPYSGFWKPREPLASLNGREANGRWVLKVADVEEGGDGLLRGFCLHINEPMEAAASAHDHQAETPAQPVTPPHSPATAAPAPRTPPATDSPTPRPPAEAPAERPDASAVLPAAPVEAGVPSEPESASEAGSEQTEPEAPEASQEPSTGARLQVQADRWLTLDGEPFFPILVWTQPPTSEDIGYFKRLGFNGYYGNGYGNKAHEELLTELQRQEMLAVLEFDERYVDHPSVMAWMYIDEIDGKGGTPEMLQGERAAIRAIDPARPIVLNVGGGFYVDRNFDAMPENLVGGREAYKGLFGAADIASFDFYPVTGWNNPNFLYIPGAATARIHDEHLTVPKPVWAIIEASDQDLSWTPPSTRGPTAEEMRFQIWDSIINGATGLGYFTIAFEPFRWRNYDASIEREMLRTNTQIRNLTSVILSPEAPEAATVTSSEPGGINWTVRRSEEHLWIIALNADMRRRPATATVRLNSGTIAGVREVTADRSISAEGDSFTDFLAPLEVRIYRIEPKS